MRLDGKGVIKLVDKNTGDGFAVDLGTVCCGKFAEEFPLVLGAVFDGKVAFVDVDSDGDGSKDTFSGMKAIFKDIAGNVIAETPLDGTQGKVDFIDTGYSKRIVFKGVVAGSGSSEVYIAQVGFILQGIDTYDMKSPVQFDLGVSDAPAKSPLAQVDSNTGKKGIPVTPDNTNFEFELIIELR